MRKRIVAAATAAMIALAVCGGTAIAEPNCTGKLSDRAASCFNAGPGQPGFQGP